MPREAPHPLLPQAGPSAPSSGARPRATVLGGWHYHTLLRSRGLYFLAILFSVGFHVLILFGFNHRPKVVRQVVEDDSIAVRLEMPDLKDLEEPENLLDAEEPPLDAGVPVPTLPDVPTQVDLSSAFMQQIDYNTLLPPPDLSAAKTISIPANIARGSRLGAGMKNLFNLADLDRVPTPVVQVKPVTPTSLKRTGGTAEVRVAFIVDTEGRVVSPMAISSTDPGCESAAVMAISKWKFRPGMKGGRRVNTRMMQPFIFTINELD